ncbi:hypothetical protein [Nonomuraea fuscirosea]|uniref:hypothetical protein n=1 Tax=Nonomuraea fuscirosea TaxID=1291556 RepID=UPI0033FC161A
MSKILFAAVVCVAATTPPMAAHAAQTVLTCRISTAAGQPVTFTPAVGFLPRTVTAQGTLVLTGCSSTAPAAANLRSGRLTVHGTGRAFCTGVQNIRGKGHITWYGADGGEAGVSTLRPELSQVRSHNPGDMLLSGTITKGPLAGARTAGSATPTSDVSTCATRGITGVHGAGTMTFSL